MRAGDLIPHPKNWRRHPAGQVAVMRAALTEIGFADALLVRETKKGLQIIDGHLRAELNPDQKVPVLVLDVTAKEADKLLATFDPIAAMAETDIERLSALAGTLDFDVPELGDLVAATLGEAGGGGDITEDDPPDAQDGPCVAQVGDVWRCGRHRVVCGDLFNSWPDEQFDLILTDPPYNVGREYTDATDDDRADYAAWSRKWFTLARSSTDRLAFSCGHPNVVMWAGIEPWHWMICWYKGNAMLGSPFGFCNWEPVLFYGKPHRPKGHDVIVQPIVVQADLDSHDCPKQLGFGVQLLELLTDAGHSVFDPFLGSGTTLIAAEQLGRTCYGIEIEPRYVDVILRRYMNFTDVSPVRESDGVRFADLVTAEAVPA